MHNVLVLTAAIMKSQFLYQLCDVQVQLLLERVVQHCIVDNNNDIYTITLSQMFPYPDFPLT